MYIDKQIKKEITLIVLYATILLLLFVGITYAYFYSVDRGEETTISIGDLRITYCIEEYCNKNYSNFGQIIGTKNVNGSNIVEGVYPYRNDEEALNSNPYIFNIKNTGTLKSYVTIMLKDDKNYYSNDYTNIINTYPENIKIGVSNCDERIDRENVVVQKYTDLENNIIMKNKVLLKDEDATICLWTWLDENTPNEAQNSYFVANLDFKVEYKPR